MPYYGSLKVIDRSGWLKSIPLEKALLMVGSASINDIILPEDRGSGVGSVHLQLIRPQAEQSQMRAINLASTALTLTRAGTLETSLIPAHATLELDDGDSLQVGDFSLTFSIQSQAGLSQSARSEHLGLKLELPGLVLKANKQLAGQLTVANYGSQNRCQFELDLEGLPNDCYQIDPAPMLYPNGEEHLRIRFFHRGTRPLGGSCLVTLRATAPNAYPTEEVCLPITLDVAALYQFDVTVQESKNPAPLGAQVFEIPERAPLSTPPAFSGSGPFQPETPPPAPPNSLPDSLAEALLAETLPDPAPMPEPELEADWWSAPRAASPEPVSRPNPARRARLALNGQNIQVLRTPQDPAAETAAAGLPEESEPIP